MAAAAGIGIAAGRWLAPFAIAQSEPKVVIVGGGAGGATVAHYLKTGAPSLDVTLIELTAGVVDDLRARAASPAAVGCRASLALAA